MDLFLENGMNLQQKNKEMFIFTIFQGGRE